MPCCSFPAWMRTLCECLHEPRHQSEIQCHYNCSRDGSNKSGNKISVPPASQYCLLRPSFASHRFQYWRHHRCSVPIRRETRRSCSHSALPCQEASPSHHAYTRSRCSGGQALAALPLPLPEDLLLTLRKKTTSRQPVSS